MKNVPNNEIQILQTGTGMVSFQLISFISGILLARGLGPEQLGQFQLTISIVVFISLFAKLGLDEGLSYKLPLLKMHKPNQLTFYIVYSLFVVILLSIMVSILIYSFSNTIADIIFKLGGLSDHLKNIVLLLPGFLSLIIGLSILRGLNRSDIRALIYYYIVSIAFLILLYGLSPKM